MNEDIQKLELRITELENKLKSVGGGGQSAGNIDPEDMKVYQRVSQQLGMGGCINECQPLRCFACHSCNACITCIACLRCNTECVCGPCNLCVIGFGTGSNRFGSLG
ncbi:MAG TPA: hypothetical protein VNS32_27505 [Flavisolibacter sp.]|nr:hypothetical protein [Flavisolibacter sp.]